MQQLKQLFLSKSEVDFNRDKNIRTWVWVMIVDLVEVESGKPALRFTISCVYGIEILSGHERQLEKCSIEIVGLPRNQRLHYLGYTEWPTRLWYLL